MAMKTYEDYCKEYEKVISNGKAKGHNMAISKLRYPQYF